jgi:outer membrane receptor protein involved in Fe transport
LYASGRLEVMGMVTLRAGARGDWIQLEAEDRLSGGELGPDRTLSAFSPFASFSHAVGTQGSLYLSYSQAFHAPTLDQIYGQRPFSNPVPPFDPPFFVISNAGLDPQRAASFEAGGRWDGAGGEYAMLTLYRIAVEDEIDFDLASFRYANLSKSVHSGVQGAGSMRFGRGLAAFASATWQPTTIDGGDLDGNQINAVPEAMAAGRLSWSANAWLGVEAGARWVGRQWLDKENDHPLGDYATFDLGASARFSRLRASVRVGNVLDREIVETGFIGATGEERLYPAAGRHFTVALKYE